MLPLTLKSTLFIGVVSVATLELLARLYYRKRKATDVINDVLFFSDKSAACTEHVSKNSHCKNEGCAYSNIRRMIEYIESTKVSLDICIYLVTCYDLANAILKVHKEGKRVRVIADASMSEGSGSQIILFRKHGIPVRMKTSPFLMHHKFCTVDSCLLLTGSFNWTMQAITGNWDHVIITSDPNLVTPFDSHFNVLWREFSGLCATDAIL